MADEQFPKPALDKFRLWHFWWLVVFSALVMIFFLGAVKVGLTQDNNGFPKIKGEVSGKSNFFKITDSDYLNVTLKSSSLIEALVSSAPKVVSVVIQPNAASPLQLTFFGFAPNKTYYRYDNSFKNETIFNTDGAGSFSFIQDLSQGHHIWVQETHDTFFIPADCNSSVGMFNQTTNTCTLKQDLNTNIEITDNGLTLDCNNHKLSDGFRWTSFAILLNNKQNVTVKNCVIENATNAINVTFSDNNTFINNSTTGNNTSIRLISSNSNTVSGNTSSTNGQGVTLGSVGLPISSRNNIITGNVISDILFGITVNLSQSNRIERNTITGHSSTGVHITGLANANILSENVIAQNAFGVFVLQSDGTTLVDNTIRDNQNGIAVGVLSFGTKVFHNNFINNTTQAQAFTASSFDNGLPDGGNFWNNYNTPAEGCNNLNNDNFCDASFVFTGGQDNFPWTRQDGWKIKPIGQNAAELAKELVNSAYLYGGKGWDFHNSEFVASSIVKSGYNFWNQSLPTPRVDFGVGVDCSGLIMWSYNRSFDPLKSRFNNFVKAEGADEQFRKNTEPVSEAQLAPGDVIFSDFDDNGFIDHVAMYVGESGGFDVVSAADPDRGIVPDSKDRLKNISGFVAFKRVVSALSPNVLISASSPVDLIVTDPDGFIITPETIIPSELEFLRQIPGVLYYSEIEQGADGRPIDQVYSYTAKTGDYLIKVLPEPGASTTETFSLSFTTDLATTTVLAENVPISDIPTQSYKVRLSEGGNAEVIIPATIKIEPETLNLSSKGNFTVFLQIEPGFGVSVRDVNPTTIRIAGAQPIRTSIETEDAIKLPETKKGENNKKGDDDDKEDDEDDEKEDEVLTLLAKFRVRDLTGVSLGKNISLTLSGQLLDGTKIEGSDTVRVIKKGGKFSVIIDVFYSLTDIVTSLFATITNPL